MISLLFYARYLMITIPDPPLPPVVSPVLSAPPPPEPELGTADVARVLIEPLPPPADPVPIVPDWYADPPPPPA
jgi:hypothetical protein